MIDNFNLMLVYGLGIGFVLSSSLSIIGLTIGFLFKSFKNA